MQLPLLFAKTTHDAQLHTSWLFLFYQVLSLIFTKRIFPFKSVALCFFRFVCLLWTILFIFGVCEIVVVIYFCWLLTDINVKQKRFNNQLKIGNAIPSAQFLSALLLVLPGNVDEYYFAAAGTSHHKHLQVATFFFLLTLVSFVIKNSHSYT